MHIDLIKKDRHFLCPHRGAHVLRRLIENGREVTYSQKRITIKDPLK
jgi:hypothetical protein